MDPFFWMRDRSNPKVLEYLKRENEYSRQMMKHTRGLREKLYWELRGRMREDDQSAPYRKGDYWYYERYEYGMNYCIHCRRHVEADDQEEILLDLNEIARDHDYLDLGAFEISPDHRRLAYTIDPSGKEQYTLHFRDLQTGETLDDPIYNVHARVKWAQDSRTALYTTLDDTFRSWRLHRHCLGTAQSADPLVYQEDDAAFRLIVTKSRSGRYIYLRSESQITTEVRFIDAADPKGEFRLVQPGEDGVEYYVMHRDDQFFILTNYEALNFRVMSAPVAAPQRDNWREVIAHRDGVLIEDTEIFANHLVLFERERGLNTTRVVDLRTGEDHYIEFNEQLLACWSGINARFDTNVFRMVYSSLVIPETVMTYNMDTREKTNLKVEEVVGGYDPSAYHSECIYARAVDGADVPITLVHRAGLKRDGSNPLMLYGYGAYGSSLEPEFWSGRLSLLDRGFVYAIAHVRGGSELGREWYEGGKLLAKKNTFTDFIGCIEHLIAEGYTTPERLVIEGSSAGGLLIGAVANMRPDLCQAAIADVPFVDVVNTMLDESIPRTATEYDEWGNPEEDKQVRDYLRSYSPYENVAPRDYPNMLITAGLNDPRIRYWEPAMWAAKLRALKTDDNLLLLRTNFRSGHFGASGRFDYLREFAFELAFIFDVLGIEA